MRRRSLIGVLLVAVLTAASVAGAAAEAASPVASPMTGAPVTLTLVERAGHTETRTKAATSPIGDMIIWGPAPLYDATNTHDTGATTQGTCVAFDAGADCLVTEVIVFADGSTLQLQGIQPGATIPSTRTIVGGSGRYRGATGTQAVTPSADRTTWTKTFAIWP